MRQINFTKKTIDALPLPNKGKRSVYYDVKTPALAIRMTSTGHKSFTIIRKIDRRSEKITLGTYPHMSIEQARKKAAIVNAEIAGGMRSANCKGINTGKSITFGEFFEEYLVRHAKPHKKTWQEDQRKFNRYLSHWKKMKISHIRKSDIQQLHTKIGEKNGKYTANRLLELLSIMFSCGVTWEICSDNLTLGIKHFPEKSRDRFLQPDELPRFFKALDEEFNSDIQDYIYLSLFTGARKSNLLSMQWNEISFTSKVWRIPETKNGESITIPLVEEALLILIRRKETKQSESSYVFPSEKSASGHLSEPKKGWERILKRANITDLRIHDLRRSLGSWQASTGASLSIIGKSLGHKSIAATSIYARLNLDPVRNSIELATKAMIKAGRKNANDSP